MQGAAFDRNLARVIPDFELVCKAVHNHGVFVSPGRGAADVGVALSSSVSSPLQWH